LPGSMALIKLAFCPPGYDKKSPLAGNAAAGRLHSKL
jgi:hypothetical protein